MRSNQIDILFGILAVLSLVLIGEYYLYYQFSFHTQATPALTSWSHVIRKLGLIPRTGFVASYFVIVLIQGNRTASINHKKYSFIGKASLFLMTAISAGLFIEVVRIPPVVLTYPLFLLSFLISCIFFSRMIDLGNIMKDNFLIKMDNRIINNDYSFNFETDKGIINVPNPFAGILVLGAAGSGKTVSIAEPVIEQMVQKNYSGVVYDFKFPTLSSKVYTEMCKGNESPIELCIVNFTDLTRSNRVNIFSEDNLPTITHAFEYTNSLVNNLLPESIEKKDFWIRSASTLLTATIWYLRKHHKAYCTLPHVVDVICNGNSNTLIKMLGTDLETAGLVKSLQEAVDLKAGNQLAGVLATLQSTLVTINNPDIFWVLTGDDFTMDLNNPKKPKLLCIGTTPEIATSLSPVVSCMVTVAIKQLNQQDKHHSIVLLDEAPQIFIPNLSNLPATGRSNKVVTMFMAQNIPQMLQLYKQQETDSILGNLSTQFYGRARDLKTAEYVSKVFGKEEKVNQSYSTNLSQNDSRSYGRNESLQLRDLVKAQDVYNLSTGNFYGVTIESDNPSFFGKILVKNPTEVKLEKIPAFAKVTPELINKNYARVRAEILALLDGEIPRDKPLSNVA